MIAICVKPDMELDTPYKMHLQDKAELISAADAYELEALVQFIKPEQSLLGKWLDGDGSVRYETLAEFTRLHKAHTIFYSVVKALARSESKKDVKNFSKTLLESSHLNSASLDVGVASHHLKSFVMSLHYF